MDAMTTTPPDASTTLAQWIAEENKVLQALLAGPGPGVARPDQIDGKTGLEQMQAMLQGELPYAASTSPSWRSAQAVPFSREHRAPST